MRRSSKHRLTRRGLFTVGGALAAAGVAGGSTAALGGGADATQNGHGAGAGHGAARGGTHPKAGGAGATPSGTPAGSLPTPYSWKSGTGHGKSMKRTVISATARGRLRPVWEILHNHYARRRRLSTPYLTAMAEKVRAEGGDYGPNSGGYDRLGSGTLLYSK
ncbi:hypothetical protein RKE30_09105 [Streptomyces sp. Li-HN-5-11]|uniref:hypothetical protein n=1 Tax=Streptomyces sp. Li-HN-5-11 TaxID=3075432 RepID=UPI0028AF1FA6|nr:hypothetical protein [Streptomyces sp. Li-HN-5-11]WNM30552.1 hypothetical protein RKE30_09105 [Streptomyces sp. Li-HN-5-11]